jgi:hypothetical protein
MRACRLRSGTDWLLDPGPEYPLVSVSTRDRISLTIQGSFRITVFGLRTILHRIELDIISRDCPPHLLTTVFQAVMVTLTKSVTFTKDLSFTDRTMFWMPCAYWSVGTFLTVDTFHHLSNIGSLLLRIASERRIVDMSMSNQAIDLCKVFCTTLAAYWQEEHWDMADETLKRLAEPAFTVGKDCPGARDVYTIISNALGYPTSGKPSQTKDRHNVLTAKKPLGTTCLSRAILASSMMVSIPRFGPSMGRLGSAEHG